MIRPIFVVGWLLDVGLLDLFIRKQSHDQVRRRQVQTMYASDFHYLIDCKVKSTPVLTMCMLLQSL